MGSGNTPGKDSQTPSDYYEYGDLPESSGKAGDSLPGLRERLILLCRTDVG
jgi:hypothetical protein